MEKKVQETFLESAAEGSTISKIELNKSKGIILYKWR